VPPPDTPAPAPNLFLKSVFWPALFFGLAVGGIVYFYKLAQPLGPFGIVGRANDAFFSGLSSVFIYGFCFALAVFIWRKLIIRIPGIKIFSAESGCVSMSVFFGAFFILFVYLIANTNPETARLLTNARRTLMASNSAQPATATPYPTRPPLPTIRTDAMNAPQPQETHTPIPTLVLPTTDPLEEKMRLRVYDLFRKDYIRNLQGLYYRMSDFEKTLARSGTSEAYFSDRYLADLILRMDMSWESADAAADKSISGCGVAFFRTDQGSYETYLGLDGIVYLRRYGNGQNDAYWQGKYRPVGFPQGEAELLLAVQYGRMVVFIDGFPVLDIEDKKWDVGELGLMITSGTNKDFGIRCQMENVDLWTTN